MNDGQKMMRTGADCVIEGLKKAGVEVVFGLPGGAVLDIFSKLYHAPFQFILARHEQGAVHMADGYARATGKPGCCIVTSGPGATNAVTGLATANMDAVPMVCISGQVPLPMIGNDAFQEADTVGITRSVTKHNYLVKDVDDLPSIIEEAFHIATTGKPGPVLIDIPKDIQQASTSVQIPEKLDLPGYNPTTIGHPGQISRLAKAINNASKPVLYVGGGVISANASKELTELAHKAGLPVTTTLMGLGAFPETDPLALRMLGMHGTFAANNAVTNCDLLVAVASRFDDRVIGRVEEFAKHAKKAHIDIDPSSIGKSVAVDIPIVGDVKQVLIDLLPKVNKNEHPEWMAQINAWRAERPLTYDKDSKELLPQYVIEQIYELSNGEAIITTEVGQHQMWSAHFFKYTKPRTFLSSGGLGTMGYGLPAAIGAQVGARDKLVVDIGGDGSTQMNIQELVVAVEHNLPVNIVILNNCCLGMVRQWQDMFYKGEHSGTVLTQDGRPQNEKIKNHVESVYLPDFIKIAEAHGAMGLRVKTKDELIPALKKAFETNGPVVVECMVSPDENLYPMVPPGAPIEDMIHTMT